MRLASAFTFVLLLGLAGCGYVGPVLPPSPELPPAITDLVVLERGDQLQISFTVPARTTDNLAIDHFSQIDLRIGEAPHPFDFDRWADSATEYQTSPPPPADDPHNPRPESIAKTLPAKEWFGKRVTVAVRTAVRKNDHFSSWSNLVAINVIPPLQPPEVHSKATANGVLLTWAPVGEGLQYRISRQSATDKETAQIGTSKTPDYVDTTSQFDIEYKYTVVAFRDLAESLPSKPETITPLDRFAPSVPASITALAGPNTVEVTWQRSPESDLKGYYLFRSVNNGPFERIGDLLTVPAYSDHAVEHGKTYRYQVSAIDQKNNISDKSAPAEAAY